MANHPSALKRARQNEIRRLQNKKVKTRVKNVIKEVRLSTNESSGSIDLNQLNVAKSIINKAAKKGALHRNTASRKISRLSRLKNPINS